MVISFMFIGKLIATVFGEGVLALFCLWPINDKQTSLGQWFVFILLSMLFIGWMFSFYPTRA